MQVLNQFDSFQSNGSIPSLPSSISEIGDSLPIDYLEFLIETNGGEGWKNNSYLEFWKADEIMNLNNMYEVKEFCDGYVLLGSTGGEEAIALRIKDKALGLMPFIGMAPEEFRKKGNSLSEFVDSLPLGD